MRLNNVLYTLAGLVAGAGLTVATVAIPIQTASAQQDAHMMAVKGQLMAVTFQLDKSGLHDLDIATHAGTIPSGALGNVRRARVATMATDWPESMREMATQLGGQMMALEEALRSEDPAAAAPHAKAIHDTAHDVSAAVYTMLSGQTAPAHSH